ncbi:NACHT domain-containing protein [Leptolyngbyaceae cyanobacterium CCMR0082]|uniref:NACHT domain-containing protein n=1 Tax=Adonisia turfae CCMR0082 TaxID=2304604 RepID=A0A6M0SG88_9CYAN|nr:NACHT domain-containing protein [Adonisia turfae]NEZ67600.1 NACHT domain-containing protein [Adonisia turfae CCMR0082]
MTTPNNPFPGLQLFLSKFGTNIAMSSGIAAALIWSKKVSNLDISEVFFFSFTSAIFLEILKNLFQRFTKRLETKLGEKVDSLADYLFDGVSLLIQLLRYQAPLRFIDRYQKFVQTLYGDFELPGSKANLAFNCELEEVYISFNFSYDDYHKTPIRPTDEYGLSAIWQSLTSRGGTRKYQPIMITGNPGAGKTTLLKYLLLASSGVKRTKATRKFRRLIPVFLPLREITSTILSDPSQNLATLVETQESIQTLNPALGWFHRQLKRGRCLVMLDGMDEIGNEQDQAKIGHWISQQIRLYPDSAFIVTSRPFTDRKEIIKGITTFLEIRSINFKQAERFILSWYEHHEEMKSQGAKNKRDRAATVVKAHRKANELIVRIKRNPYLFQLTSTPLLLIMIITIYENGYELPKSRGALYKEICKVMIERRTVSEGQQKSIQLTADQTLLVLQGLAFELVMKERLLFSLEDQTIQSLVRKSLNECPGGEKISVETFISYVVNDVGLLTLSDKVGFYEFNHRCIQEYLAASMIKNKRCEHLLIARILHAWWSETIRLYAAQSNATRIIEEAHKLATSGTKSVVAFKLVYDCLAEAMQVDLPLRTRLENALDTHLNSDDPILRTKAAEVKIVQRFDRLVPVARNLEIDQTHVMACEYQLFIDEQRRSTGAAHQPDYWLKPVFTADMALQPIMGIRPQDATTFCTWLTQKYGHGNFAFRLPKITEEVSFFQERLIQQQSSGGWCTQDDICQLANINLNQSKAWRHAINQQLSHQIYWAQQLKTQVSRTIDVCLKYQQMDGKAFFNLTELLPHNRFSSHHTTRLGLDVTTVDNLIMALKLVTSIYQKIQRARTEAKGYGISQQRKAILELASWTDQSPILRHYQLGNTFRQFEKRLGLHDYPIRDLAFKVVKTVLAILIEFLTLTEHHIVARIRDLKTAWTLCEEGISIELQDMSKCTAIGQILLADLKKGCTGTKQMPKLLKQLSGNEIGLIHLMYPKWITHVENDFEQSFSRQFASQRNVMNTCAHLLMASSMWYSLTKAHPLGKNTQIIKQLTQNKKLSDMSYLNKRNQALKAYVLAMLLEQQIQGRLSPWGSIRIVRERILD